jgi:hypothetical protein
VKVTWLSDGLTEEKFLDRLFSSGDLALEQPNTELVIYSRIEQDPSPELETLASLAGPGRRILVHLSDEKLRHHNSLYKAFDVVFRNYFDPRIAWRRNVVFIPLGWTSTFGDHATQPKLSPSFSWSFCGATKADRKSMVDHFVRIPGGFHHFSSGWNSDDQLPPEKVRDIYNDSLFVLCPQGNAHIDTFRVMEALQVGAIPVAISFLGRDFFRYTFGEHPFIVEKDWATAASRVRALLAEPSEALAYRRRVQEWYSRYLYELMSMAAALAEGRISPAHGRVRNHHVWWSRFDLQLMVAIALRFRGYRRVRLFSRS